MGDKSDKLFEVTRGSKSDALRIWQIKFLEDIAIAVGGGGGMSRDVRASRDPDPIVM